MDAPLYPPASHFELPERVARSVSTGNTPIAELMKIPAAWAIVVKGVPGIEQRLNTPQLKPHLGNFSLRSLVQFGFSTSAQLDSIDAQLKALGEIK
jgi:hypothetical protein